MWFLGYSERWGALGVQEGFMRGQPVASGVRTSAVVAAACRLDRQKTIV